ncbi:MAG: F0F1 ATP synthase subunit delta [Gammaproteobacteria bacterium]|nr:F0F1 ATP synthase subunit delta [Gammaproteobacteria bacterium]
MAERRTTARPYAEAAFALARDARRLKPWSDMLALLATVAGDAALQRLLDDPRLPRERLAGLIIDIGGGHLDAAGRNFVRLLAENRRLALLPEIVELYEALRAEAEAVIEADVTSAYALSETEQEKIRAALRRRLGREVRITTYVDASLLGGIVIRAGDLVIDGSVRGRIAALATHLNY